MYCKKERYQSYEIAGLPVLGMATAFVQ